MEALLRRLGDWTHPLFAHEVGRGLRALRHVVGPTLLTLAPALLGVVIFGRLLDASGAVLLSSQFLDALRPLTTAQVFALACVIPLIDGAASLLPFLRGDLFEQLLLTRASRAELTWTLWGLAWLRGVLYFWLILAIELLAFLVLLPPALWADAARPLLLAAVGGVAPLAVAASLVVAIALRRRTAAALALEGLPRLLFLYPVLFLYAVVLFVCALMIFLAPLVSLGGALLHGVGAVRFLALPGGLLLASLAAGYVLFLCSVVVRLNLGAAERWCVPADWLDLWRNGHPRRG